MSYTEDMALFEQGAVDALLFSWPYMVYTPFKYEEPSDKSFQEMGFTRDDIANDIDYHTFLRECDNFFRLGRKAGIFTETTDYEAAGMNFLFGRNGEGAGYFDNPDWWGGKDNVLKLMEWCNLFNTVGGFYNPQSKKIEVYYG